MQLSIRCRAYETNQHEEEKDQADDTKSKPKRRLRFGLYCCDRVWSYYQASKKYCKYYVRAKAFFVKCPVDRFQTCFPKE